MIAELTPEQEKLIPVYQEKYKQAALCNKPIDRQKAADAVKAAYGEIGRKEPEIRFFDSPYSALTLEQLKIRSSPIISNLQVTPALIYSLPDKLRTAQRLFDCTGGLHAAALFNSKGELLSLREDFGRHLKESGSVETPPL